MYPHQDLSQLGEHKVALRAEIARLRQACATATNAASRPLNWLDRIVAFTQRLSPWTLAASLPLALLARRRVQSRFKLLVPILRWVPLALAVTMQSKVDR